MNHSAFSTSEDRKDWTAPELKKTDVESITAEGPGPTTGDDFSGS